MVSNEFWTSGFFLAERSETSEQRRNDWFFGFLLPENLKILNKRLEGIIIAFITFQIEGVRCWQSFSQFNNLQTPIRRWATEGGIKVGQ